MSEPLIWTVLAITLGVVELFTGSFYLLVLALGAAGAAALAFAGGPVTGQLLAAALISVVGTLLVRRWRPHGAAAQASRNPDVNLDIGAELTVDAWDAEGRSRVAYRGASWDVELLPGEPRDARRYRVREVVGSRLRLAAAHPVSRRPHESRSHEP